MEGHVLLGVRGSEDDGDVRRAEEIGVYTSVPRWQWIRKAYTPFTDVADCYLACDPAQAESVEIGFVGGRQEPELLMQDSPSQGNVFTNDQISYKVRWEFGAGWVDYRGALWSQVAG